MLLKGAVRKWPIPALFETAPVLGLSALMCLGCDRSLDNAECDQLLEHYTEKLIRNENPRAAPHVIIEKQRLAKELAHSDPVFEYDRCSSDISRSQFNCAMAASDVDAIERCLTL